MAGATGFIDFDIVGDRYGVQRMLRHLDSAMSPVGLALFMHVRVEPWLRERAENRFAEEGDDASGKWAPLQQSTMEIREAAGYGAAGPINRRTGELEAFITGSDADIVSAAGMTTLTYPSKGSKMSTGLIQKVATAQTGRSHPSTVKRPVLAMSERDLAHVLTQLAFHVQGYGTGRSK